MNTHNLDRRLHESDVSSGERVGQVSGYAPGIVSSAWRRVLGAITLLFAASAGSIKADNIAYLATGSADFGTVDLNTGVFSQLGVSSAVLGGLGVAGGTLYGASYRAGTGTLYTVNTANGSLSPVGTSPVDFDVFGS